MAMEVTEDLLNALSIDGNVRKHAEESLKQFQDQDLPSFLLLLFGELANDDKPAGKQTRERKSHFSSILFSSFPLNISFPFPGASKDPNKGLILKNALDLEWLTLDNNVKSQIKTVLLKTLTSPAFDARSTASQVIAKIADIELPQKQWPELIRSLLSNINQLPAHVKQATLDTLGYLCEEVSPDVVDQDQVNKILTAVVQGMNASEVNNDVRLAATGALNNALDFAQANFSNDMERDDIMRVVCEATLSSEMKIRQAAFECLVSISSVYDEKLAPHIQDIFNITAKAVREDDEPVALQAIEFWSSICEEEIDILEAYGGDLTADSELPCFYFIKQALPDLVPMVLETRFRQEEDQDRVVAWNIAMAGGTCLGLIARTVGDAIVPLVLPFVGNNVKHRDWRRMEAATFALGSILEGPSHEELRFRVNCEVGFMLTALKEDLHGIVKDTTAWTLGRMFEFLSGATLDSPIITEEILTLLTRYSAEWCERLAGNDSSDEEVFSGVELFSSLLADFELF